MVLKDIQTRDYTKLIFNAYCLQTFRDTFSYIFTKIHFKMYEKCMWIFKFM